MEEKRIMRWKEVEIAIDLGEEVGKMKNSLFSPFKSEFFVLESSQICIFVSVLCQ